MPNFRLEEDERRYSALKVEMYLRLATCGASPQVISEVLRNVAKMETWAFSEGVRQGMATAALAGAADHKKSPLAVHLDLYRDAATPLTRAEDLVLTAAPERMRDHPWLARMPVEHPPTTLAEAVAAGAIEPAIAAPAPAPAPRAPVRIQRPQEALDALAAGEDPEDLDVESLLWFSKQPDDGETTDDGEPTRPPAESPQLLDRVREHILDHRGWRPADWTELILTLHREMQMDAVVLDMLLASPSGMTVLAQVGFTHLHPGAMVEFKKDGTMSLR